MSVELPATTPVPGLSRPLATAVPEARPSAAVPPRADSGRQVLDLITGWGVSVPALLVAVTALSWSLLWRLPEKNRLLTVSARELPSPPALSKPVNQEELTKLRQQFQQLATNLIHKREDIGPLIAQLESNAGKFSLRMELSLKPAVSQRVGSKELLRHPVSIQLVNDHGQDGAAHQRFYAWLREAVAMDKRAEITSLRLRGNGAGLAEAYVELQFFSLNSHEEVASK